MTTIKEKVEAAINSSGYPLELYIGSKLQEFDQYAWYNEYFFDYDLNVARSVDIFTPNFPRKHIKDFGDKFQSQIVIECKKSSDTAWVFFEVDSVILPEFAGQFIDFMQVLKKRYYAKNVLSKINDKIRWHYSPLKSNVVKAAQNFQVVKIGDSNLDDSTGKALKRKDTIFEAVNQVTKFISYRMKRNEGISLNSWKSLGKVEPTFELFFPVIVYDGPMYNGILDGDKIKLKEIEHVVLEHNYQPSFVDERLTFLIDIVKKENFLELLPKLENDVDIILKSIDDSKEEIEKMIHGLHVTDSRLAEISR